MDNSILSKEKTDLSEYLEKYKEPLKQKVNEILKQTKDNLKSRKNNDDNSNSSSTERLPIVIKKREDKEKNQVLKFRPKSALIQPNTNRISLRTKFIERALFYQGIPYKQKYLKVDDPLYHSTLFLDCCGLVRQCVNDLSSEFGFRLGRWNQAYQFDTLPYSTDFSKIQPGDLIFYEAIHYKNNGWKDQPHNMVHVEIYLGDYDKKDRSITDKSKKSERTIAAREKKGVVQIFDSYQFTSENYYNIKYFYKPIDIWLIGIHKSFCLEHRWFDNLYQKSSRKKRNLTTLR